MTDSYIFADTAGFNARHRLTHMPSGKTLMSQPWMRQADWDRLCREFLEPYRDLEIRFEDGSAAVAVSKALAEIGSTSNAVGDSGTSPAA